MNETYIRQLKRGTLEMIFLNMLSNRPMYGGEIMQTLNNFENSFFSGAKEGSVYPVLYRLEDSGYIKSVPNGNQKKVFHITISGIEELNKMKKQWSDFTFTVNNILNENETGELNEQN